jgi:hypothetical protein
MWSGLDVIDRFSNNVVSFSRNVVLSAPLFSLNSVPKPRMLSVRADYVLSSYEVGLGAQIGCLGTYPNRLLYNYGFPGPLGATEFCLPDHRIKPISYDPIQRPAFVFLIWVIIGLRPIGSTGDLPTIAFFRAGPLLRRNGPVPGILAPHRPGAIMDKSGRRFVVR